MKKEANHLISASRSKNMSAIKSKNSKPEVEVRKFLHAMGFRFRLHKKDLPGSPDIVLPKYKTVIFVHGCFWHRHQNCKYASNPKTRVDFWNKKFNDNIERDIKVRKELENLEWNYLIIWERQIKNKTYLKEKLRTFLI